jgi:hypothetical protein
MSHLAAKRLIAHEKNEKKKYREPFCRVLAHDGVNTMNGSMQMQPNRIHLPNRMLLL